MIPRLIVALLQTQAFLTAAGINAHEAPSPPLRLHGPSTNTNPFPIGVWLQNPGNAARYREAGINLYVGLWRAPSSDQLDQLQRAGLSVICAQSRAALELKHHPAIVGWMHEDEPDNAQSLGEGKGYGPPISPATILQDYQRMRAADPTRPVLLNLGQGVAWDNWIGRGVRRNHPEDYAEYVRGCDIASFDIYPVVHEDPEVAGKLEFVARGVERLRQWAGAGRSVWNCIETTRIGNPQVKPTPDQVRAEVWMAIIRGSRGLIYFAHQFKPNFREAALLDDPEMVAAITRINRQIQELAPVIHAPDLVDGVMVESSEATPIAWMARSYGQALYLFAVNLGRQTTQAGFTFRESVRGFPTAATVRPLGESHRPVWKNRGFVDAFKPYEVHLYELRQAE